MCSRMVVFVLCVLLSAIGCSKDEEPEPGPAVPGGEAVTAPDETEAVQVETEASPGEVLVQKQCATCHTIKRIEAANLDRAGWERMVDQMIDKGARLDEAERKIVIDYLSSR